MRVLITGKTGLVGTEITRILLNKGHEVNYLTTDEYKVRYSKTVRGFFWNPNTHEIDTNCFKNVEVIIHLAGATVSKRWTPKYKKQILDSRIKGTKLLYDALQKTEHTVRHIVSASAIGVYEDSIEILHDETSTKFDKGFLATVVHEWEKAVDLFENESISVCTLRIGLVLAKSGGALPEIRKPIEMGLGATFGTGNQIQSWIHLQDLANLFVVAAEDQWIGIYNAVSPRPISNKTLTETIAAIRNKPLFLPNIPKFFMQLVLGEMHQLLFASQFVSAKKIVDKGFIFEYEFIDDALQNLLK